MNNTEIEKAIESLQQQQMSIECQEWEHDEEELRLDSLALAITALKSQSSAEQKIERITRYCKTCRNLIRMGKQKSDVSNLTDIIYILEGEV